MSTGIQKGIASPHGKTNAVDKVYGMLGVSRKGIDYEALDGNPVYLVFLVLGPVEDSEKHLKVLQRMAELLANPQFFSDIAAQGDARGVHGIIKNYEELVVSD
jgi:PTS system fructose-specific IIC component/PTS system nitrogen regulatory IIA component